MPETEPEPIDPELHPDEYRWQQIDQMFEESDLACFAIWEQIIERIKH